MCGLAGAIGRTDGEVRVAVRRMSDRQKHRGPDAEGAWSYGEDGQGVELAHRRLAIIDLSPDANQPMVDPETGNALVYNGEIYNYRELRLVLEAEGARFRTRSDTEVLLKAYGKWGEGCLGKLRGMFAFAIWDARQARLILARDRVGIKPLYTSLVGRPDGRCLLFASELRALLASGLVERRLSRTGLATYVWNGFVVGPCTIVRGVRLLPAGSYMVVSPGGEPSEPIRYWKPPPCGEGEGVEELGRELSEAVRMRLVSDVPLGIFLSGGIDSTAVTSLAVASGAASIRTFNISFDEAEYDESRYARSVAAALGTDHTEIRLGCGFFREHLEEALHSLDQPTFDAINTFFVSRAVREAGIKVALAGTGGDELFGGYRSFRDLPAARRLSRWLGRAPEPLLRLLAALVARWKLGAAGTLPPQVRWGKLMDVLRSDGEIVRLYQISYGLFTTKFYRELMAFDEPDVSHGLPRSRSLELAMETRGQKDLHAVSLLEVACFLGQRLLRDTDAASMAVGLEVRVPLLDHLVMEKLFAVQPHRRFKDLGAKHVLRELALKGLDPDIFDRPKSGFLLPIEVWCRAELRDQVGALLGNRDLCGSVGLKADAVARLWRAFEQGAPGIYWSRVWAVFVLLWWCREHGVH